MPAQNVLLVENSPKVGGGNRSLLLLAHGLRERGHCVTISLPGDGPMKTLCDDEGFVTLRSPREISWNPIRVLSNIRGWRRILKTNEIDIVHTNNVLTARSVAFACRSTETPLVCHVRYPPNTALVRWAFRRIPKPDAFIFNSQAMQTECGADVMEAAPKATQHVVYNAVDQRVFKPDPRPHPGHRIAILANLVPVKGHEDFLRMAAILRETHENIEFWVIGEDVLETGYGLELEGLANNMNLKNHVRFLGFQSDVPSILNSIDILVCASHVEPFGRCLIEAMACGVPVVATNVGGIPEVVIDGETGYLRPAGNPDELANAVLELLASSERRASFVRNGLSSVSKSFSVKAHLDAIVPIYSDLLENRSFDISP